MYASDVPTHVVVSRLWCTMLVLLVLQIKVTDKFLDQMIKLHDWKLFACYDSIIMHYLSFSLVKDLHHWQAVL